MRVLCPIVAPELLLMRAGQPKLPECRGIGAQLVSNQQFRREALLPEQLAHQPQRRPGVAPIHTAPDAQPPTNADEQLGHAPELLPLPVGSKSRLSNAVPSVQFHYRTF